MLSSLESYTFYTRDTVATYDRIANSGTIAREAAYYAENISSVSSVEEFMDNDRLYNYAMRAYGLEEMTYAKGMIKKVLESDLSDEDSFANLLDDVRYQELAAAFDFGLTEQDPTVQSDQQLEDLIGTYTASIDNVNADIQEEHRYYNAVISQMTNVSEIFQYPRVRDYIFESYGIDSSTYDYETTVAVLTSDPTDTESYVYKEYIEKSDEWSQSLLDAYDERTALVAKLTEDAQTNSVDPADAARLDVLGTLINQYNVNLEKADIYIEMAGQFNFLEDGTLAAGVLAQDEDQLATAEEKYVLAQPRLTYSTALINKTYYEEQMATADSLNDILYDTRLRTITLTSFGINLSYDDNDLRTAFSEYATDPSGEVFLALPEEVRELVQSFNFDENGDVISGMTAQDTEVIEETTQKYMVRYNDLEEVNDEELIDDFERYMPLTADLDDFLSDLQAAQTVRNFALTAHGIEEDELTTRELRAILTSDLGDPDSYVNQSGDDRFKQLAKSFNFDENGDITTPRAAQSENELTRITKAYYTEITRFDSSSETDEAAEEEVAYYRAQVSTLETVDDFINDQRLIDFLAVSEGLEPEDLEPEFLRELLMSDPDDPDSLLNQQTDVRFHKIFGSFSFNENGSVASTSVNGVQSNRGLAETQHLYLTQAIEEEAGEDSVGARLALYFERKASSISTLYEVIADPALADFVRTALSIPDETASSDIDAQVTLMERFITAEDFQDPEKVNELVTKFLALYDAENGLYDPIVDAFSGVNSFSADAIAAYSEYQ